jgi:hypothetical protein
MRMDGATAAAGLGRARLRSGKSPGSAGGTTSLVCERLPVGEGVTTLAKPNFEYQKRQKELEKKKKKEEKLQRRQEKKNAPAEGAPEAPPEPGVPVADKAS